MNLKINKDNLKDNPEMLLKRAGYAYIYSRITEKGSFVRRLTRDHYPRLHLYVEDHGDNFVFSLHLDQKKVSYQGSHSHNADYDGPVVETEIERLIGLFGGEVVGRNYSGKKKVAPKTQEARSHDISDIPSAENSIGQGSLDDFGEREVEPKKNWFQKIFNI